MYIVASQVFLDFLSLRITKESGNGGWYSDGTISSVSCGSSLHIESPTSLQTTLCTSESFFSSSDPHITLVSDVFDVRITTLLIDEISRTTSSLCFGVDAESSSDISLFSLYPRHGAII